MVIYHSIANSQNSSSSPIRFPPPFICSEPKVEYSDLDLLILIRINHSLINIWIDDSLVVGI